MGKYIQGDFDGANSKLADIDSMNESINNIKTEINNYVANLLLKNEGEGIDAIAHSLGTCMDNVQTLLNKSSVFASMVSSNTSISNIFNPVSKTEISSDDIDELKKQLDEAKSNLSRARSLANYYSTSSNVQADFMAALFQGVATSFEAIYNSVHKKYIDLKNAYDDIVDIDQSLHTTLFINMII